MGGYVKKKLLILLLPLIVLCFLYKPKLKPPEFSSQNVYNTIKVLSSDEYKGRLAGENIMAENYIKEAFKRAGLSPGGDAGSYLQNFNVYVPEVSGSCTLKVFSKDGKIKKEYVYGKDFKEVTFGASIPGTVYSGIKSQTDLNGRILIDKSGIINETKSQYEADKKLKLSGYDAVIYSTNRFLRFRTPYKLQMEVNDGLIKIMATPETCSEIEDFSSNGCFIEIKSSCAIKKCSTANVIGILYGKSDIPPLIISAHFDHVGYDADGTVYGGAFDNASGTAFLIECARVLKLKGVKRTIIFAAFNAEEEGMIGSSYFTKHSSLNLKDSECINFDMVGCSSNMPLTVLSSSPKEKYAVKVLNILSKSAKCNLEFEDNSDHSSFCSCGINSVTLINEDTTKIHTPYDTIENISKEKIEEVYRAFYQYLASSNVW